MLAVWLGLLLPALAQDAPEPEAKPEKDKSAALETGGPANHTVSVIWSPAHLIIPMIEVTTDIRVDDRVGVSAIVGGGAFEGISLYEVGAQGRFYATGNFDSGFLVGAEVVYLGASTDAAGTAVVGSGMTGGPMFGGKHAFSFGLTLDAQVGAQFQLISASGGGETASASGIAPLVNLGLGWSF